MRITALPLFTPSTACARLLYARALIARRTEHQVAREYDEADALHAELAELNISLDTRSRSWRLDTRNSLPRRY